MTRKRMQLAAGAIAVALVAPVRADDEARRSTGIEDPARVGLPGGGTERTPRVGGAIAGERELSGTVVKADARTLYLEHMGAIVPLKIDEKTRFSGEGVSSAKDLAEGQEVRASFTVEKRTTNVARRISVASASERSPGSTGSTGAPPAEDERIPPGSPPLPPERGPGIPPDRPPMPGDPPGTPAPSDPGAPPSPNY